MRLVLLSMLIISEFAYTQTPILVADGSFKVSGVSEETIYYGFAKGDKVEFTLKEQFGKDIKEIEIIEYPNSSRFIEFKKSSISKSLIIPKNGIYQFRIYNSSLGRRVCQYKIERTPASVETASFNTSVYWKTIYDTTYTELSETFISREEYIPKVIVPFSEFYINSGSNATFLSGTSRITIPVNLPENTVKWFYEFSAFREEADLKKVNESFSLAGQLIAAIEPTMAIATISADLLSSPPGSNYCDVHLLDFENKQLFESKQDEYLKHYVDGSRENIKSGIIEIEWGAGQQYYIGIKNPSGNHGIHVSLEVVAVVYEIEYAERTIAVPKITSYQKPYLKN